MKPLLILILFWILSSSSLHGQEVGSLRQDQVVDSLVRVTDGYIQAKVLDTALMVLRVADSLASSQGQHPSWHPALVQMEYGILAQAQKDLPEALSRLRTAMSMMKAIDKTENLDYARCLSKLGAITIAQEKFDQTEGYLKEATEIRRRISGNLDPELARDLANMGYACINSLQYEKAEIYTIESLDIQREVYGETHMTYIANLLNLANLYSNMRLYAKAEPLFLHVKTVLEDQGRGDGPNFAWILNRLGDVYQNLNDFEQAESYFLKAKEILVSSLGEDHPRVAKQLTNLAELYRVMGRYELAENLTLKALEIESQTLGQDHPEYAAALNELGIIYSETGRYEKAAPLYAQSMEIVRNQTGKESDAYLGKLNNMAILCWQMGDYDRSEQLYLELIALNEKIYGYESIQNADALYNLAIVYGDIHNYTKAEELYVKASDIQKSVLGETHSDYATGLVGLGGLYDKMNEVYRAEACIRKARDIREKIYGRKHYFYTTCLELLAHLMVARKDYPGAEAMYRESIVTGEEVLGEHHPDLALSLQGFGDLYTELGAFDDAEAQYRRAMNIYDASLGPNHPLRAGCLFNLGVINEHLGRWATADTCLKSSMDITRSQLARGTAYLSGQELADYVSSMQGRMETISSCLANRLDQGQPIGDLARLDYDLLLFFKGFLLMSAERIHHLARSTPETASQFDELNGCRRYLARELAKPVDDQKHVAEFENRANVLEKELSRSLAGYAANERQVRWSDVRQALHAGEGAIEFIHFRKTFPSRTDSMEYAALLIRPDSDSPKFIPLCEESDLRRLLAAEGDLGQDFVDHLYSQTRQGYREPTAPTLSLADLIWEPLATQLGGLSTLYIATSGMLHQINLGAIQLNDEETVADRFNLVRLGSTRQVIEQDLPAGSSDMAVLFGGIRYDGDTLAIESANLPVAQQAAVASRGIQWQQMSSAGGMQGSWSYLRGTAREVAGVAGILDRAGMKTALFTDFSGTEEMFKSLGRSGMPAPRLIHLATHGYFFPDPDPASGSPVTDGPAYQFSTNPMIRSGLILAGGNHAWQTGQPVMPDWEDGILTAYEISQMDLSGTELVVLSACKSGLGMAEGHEGVYGLQRAFKIAGVKYLIMSLWNVPDVETSQLMTTFYRHWLEDGLPIPDAFRQAQTEMRNRFFNPYAWAGFVLVE